MTTSTVCNPNNTITINATGSVTNSVVENVYDDSTPYNYNRKEGIAVLCFDIQPPFICANPMVNVKYETICYGGGPDYDRYLNVGYQNKTLLMNNEPCWGGKISESGCGTSIECEINPPLDTEWAYDKGPYAFYLINGKNVSPWCYSPTRSLNATITVQCSEFNPSTCQSLQYVFNCLNGIGGNPNI
eukprot:73771_1